MVSRSLLALAISFSAVSAHAYWWGSTETKGVLTVTKAFTIKRTADVGDRKDPKVKGVITLKPGKYSVSIEESQYTKSATCIPAFPMPICVGGGGDPIHYISISLLDKKGNEAQTVSFKADSTYLKDKGSAYYAKKMKQSFNIFEKSSSETKNVNDRTVKGEYCDVDMYNVSGGGGGLFYGYGSRTVSAIGEHSVRKHDEVTTLIKNFKFTDAASNAVIASYAGSRDDKREDIVDSEGECHLNKNNYKN